MYEADAYGIMPNQTKTVVAVKTLKECASKMDYDNLLKELEIMKSVGKHENIINLLGCCTTRSPIYVIVEYAKFGNLRDYLRKIGQSMMNEYKRAESSGEYEDAFSRMREMREMNHNEMSTLTSLTIDLIRFCTQIAAGMKHLHSKNVTHRDLAARNILLDEFKNAKIADFGLARDIKAECYYKPKPDAKLPIKWMAPESLHDHKTYPSSDIWSFGVLMWEIFSLGGEPYLGTQFENLYDFLREGKRLSKPEYCDDEM